MARDAAADAAVGVYRAHRPRRRVAAAIAARGLRAARARARRRCPMRKALAFLLAAVLTLAHAQPAFAYLKFGVTVGNRQVTLKWAQTPVRYFISTGMTVPGVTLDALQGAVGRAFAQWQTVPTSAIA